jgi:hypothetical protein
VGQGGAQPTDKEQGSAMMACIFAYLDYTHKVVHRGWSDHKAGAMHESAAKAVFGTLNEATIGRAIIVAKPMRLMTSLLEISGIPFTSFFSRSFLASWCSASKMKSWFISALKCSAVIFLISSMLFVPSQFFQTNAAVSVN